MRKIKSFGWLFTAFLLTACVTINIYFPAAAAEEAARAIVRDVMGKESAEPPAEEKKAPEPSSRSGAGRDVLAQLLDFLVPPAHAQGQADINIRTPAIDSIRASLSGRHPQLKGYFDSGAVGLARGGLVDVRDLGAVPLRDRNQVKKLVAEENADRNALYSEIARANGHPDWEKNIRDTFARVWVEEAPAGTWYQDAGGAWKRK